MSVRLKQCTSIMPAGLVETLSTDMLKTVSTAISPRNNACARTSTVASTLDGYYVL
jgi:hypothetical protein